MATHGRCPTSGRMQYPDVGGGGVLIYVCVGPIFDEHNFSCYIKAMNPVIFGHFQFRS